MSEQQKFTLPMATLSKMIGLVSHAATDDPWGPEALQSLQFTIGAGSDHVPHFDNRSFAKVPVTVPSLTLAATDRFRMVWATAPCAFSGEVEPGSPVRFTVTARALRALTASFPKVGRGKKAVHPDVSIERVTPGQAARFSVATEDAEQVTTLATSGVTFPDMGRVVKYDHEEAKPDLFAVNPVYAAQMFAEFNKVRGYRGPVAVSSGGDHKPVRFAMDPTDTMLASGLLMVIRQDS